jgi:APA family basic amino acid/polyamine antiporter
MSGSENEGSAHLQREISLPELTAIGVGSVIGSGIFILFSTILKKGKTSTVLALALAAIPNITTALAYAELAGMYNTNDLEYDSIRDAFNDKLATISTYILLVFMVFNAATVVLFTSHLFNMQNAKFYIGLGILFILSLVNFMGISLSKSITNTVGFVEVTLLLIVSLCAVNMWNPKMITKIPSKPEYNTFWIASFLGLFLFSGYDSVVKLSEETKNPSVNVPWGMMYTILSVTGVYLLLALTATSMSKIKDIYTSALPVTEIYKRVFRTSTGWPLTIIGIAIVLNTFFISIISLSRFSYSLSKENKLPSFLNVINDRFKTPHNAILAVFIVLAVALLIDNGEKSATFANIFFLIFMILIMKTVIVLRLKNSEKPRSFIIPFNICNIPVVLVLGIIMCIFYLYIAITCFSQL